MNGTGFVQPLHLSQLNASSGLHLAGDGTTEFKAGFYSALFTTSSTATPTTRRGTISTRFQARYNIMPLWTVNGNYEDAVDELGH